MKLLQTQLVTYVACSIATPKGKSEGGWDSIHVFEAIDRARTAHYKLTSTVILHLGSNSESLGEMNLSGNMTRQVEQDMPVEDDGSHIINVGKLIEDMESKMRGMLRECVIFRYHGRGTNEIRGGIFRQGERCCGRPSKYD